MEEDKLLKYNIDTRILEWKCIGCKKCVVLNLGKKKVPRVLYCPYCGIRMSEIEEIEVHEK